MVGPERTIKHTTPESAAGLQETIREKYQSMGACYTFPSNFQVGDLWLCFIKAIYMCYAKHSLTYSFCSVVPIYVLLK